MQTRSAAALLLLAAGCAAARRGPAPLPQLGETEAEVDVFVLPLPREAERLAFTLERIALVRADGTEVPLALAVREVVGSDGAHQRLLASGRVPEGDYAGFTFTASAATLLQDGTKSRLLVKPEPAKAPIHLRLSAAESTAFWATLDASRAVGADYAFTPAFTVRLAPQTPPQVAWYVTNTGAASVTVVDRGQKLATGVVPTGAEPRGIAVDRTATRAFVALSRADAIDILDVAANHSIGRIRLTPGDSPEDVALAADGTLLVANVRSRTVAFVDPAGMAELGRVTVGDWPTGLRLDRSGRRAYVANRDSGTVSVIDVANRAVVGALPVDPEPLRVELSRDGSRLYVMHRGSGYLEVFALPTLAPVTRAFIGPGATEIKVDTRTDLIYLARGLERRITAYDPVSLQPMDDFEIPGAVSRMAIDDQENALLALVPERRVVVVVDLTSRKVLAEVPVGVEPYFMAFTGER